MERAKCALQFLLCTCALLLISCKSLPGDSETAVENDSLKGTTHVQEALTPSHEVTYTANSSALNSHDPVAEAARLYMRFLRSEIPGLLGNDVEEWIGSYALCTDDSEFIRYSVQDLTGDGVPELFDNGPGNHSYVWTIENGRVVRLASIGTWMRLLPIGAIYYYRPGVGYSQYFYQGISAKSKEYPDVSLREVDTNNDGEMDLFLIDDEEVTKETWDEVASVYFALSAAEPQEDETSYIFSEWIAALEGFEPPPDILLHGPPVEGDENYRIFITNSGERLQYKGYTLVLFDYNGNIVQIIGYGDTYPLVEYISDGILQITKYGTSGWIEVWFFDTWSDILSPRYYVPYTPMFAMDRTVAYGSYDRDFGGLVLKVSDMFQPEAYTEIFALDYSGRSWFESIKDVRLDGRVLEVTYFIEGTLELKQKEFLLGEGLSAWKTGYDDHIRRDRDSVWDAGTVRDH